jgi:hypothetical protein
VKEILDDVLSHQQHPLETEPLPSSSASISIPTTLPLGASFSTAATVAGTGGERDIDLAWEILHSPIIKVKDNDVAAVIR